MPHLFRARSFLTLKGRGRAESLALRVVAPVGSTVLTIRSRNEPKSPLVGYEVYDRPPGAEEPVLLGRTDDCGRLTVTRGEHLLRVLLVKSGSELKGGARPCWPGCRWCPASNRA